MMNRLLDGFFHFKKRKGEIVAGSVTFFSLLSFGPILLSLISLAAFIFGSLLFGLKTISRGEFRGGFFLDDAKSLFAGVSVALFMGLFMMLSSPNIMKGWLYTSSASWNDFSDFLIS